MVFDMTLKQKDIQIGLKVDGVVDSSVQGRFIGACNTIPVIPDDEKADYAGMVILYTGSETGYTANTYYKYSGTAWEKYVSADVANKVDKISGKGLSTEDFTTALKTKLEGIDLSDYATVASLDDYATKTALTTGLNEKQDKGDYALKSEIPSVPIKIVKKDGTALTPDGTGAVNVNVKGTKVDNASHADSADSATSASSATTAGSATTARTADVAKGYTSDGAIATALAGKASTAVATTTADGLMSSADKTKLNGIDTSAKNVAFTRSLTSGTKIGTITISGTATDIYCEKNTDADTKVTQNLTSSSTTGSFPILIKNTTSTITITDQSRFVAGITVTPSTGTITATTFKGALSGNATTATTATNYSATGGIATALAGKASTSDIPTDYVPNTRKVNNKSLSADITLGASDVGAVPTSRTVNSKPLSSNISLTASDVGALSSSTTVTNVSFASDTSANAYPILMKNSTGSTTTSGGTKFNTGVTITPSTGTVTATTFSGKLSGNATSATTATTASNYASTGTIKTALDGKQATVTGGATTILSNNLTASRALISDASGKVVVSSVSSTELGYLDGVTSAIQTQLNAKQSKIISASNISVPASAWATGHADGDFIYRASITLTGCTASMIPAVVFSTSDAISGDYSPVCESASNAIYIWSKKKVAITVLTALAIPQ